MMAVSKSYFDPPQTTYQTNIPTIPQHVEHDPEAKSHFIPLLENPVKINKSTAECTNYGIRQTFAQQMINFDYEV